MEHEPSNAEQSPTTVPVVNRESCNAIAGTDGRIYWGLQMSFECLPGAAVWIRLESLRLSLYERMTKRYGIGLACEGLQPGERLIQSVLFGVIFSVVFTLCWAVRCPKSCWMMRMRE
jgi:hypothetical protein